MGKLESYRDLAVWKEARSLVHNVYEISKGFPKDEQFGLTNQLGRAAVSIPSNIAEGCGRNHFKDSIQLFFIARGSMYEVETHLLVAFDLKYLSGSDLNETMEQGKLCKKLLNGFISYFQKTVNSQPPPVQ
jgi:four helix bundle protein